MQYLFCLLVICTELNSANFRLRKFVRTCAYCVYASLLHKRAGLSSDSPTDENRSAMQALACIAGVRILRARRRELAHKSREQKYSRKARNSPIALSRTAIAVPFLFSAVKSTLCQPFFLREIFVKLVVQIAVNALQSAGNKLLNHQAIGVRKPHAFISKNAVVGRGDKSA